MLGWAAMNWFVRREDAVELGPLTESEVRALVLAGRVRQVRASESPTWTQISETPFVIRRFADLSKGEVRELVKGAVAAGAFQAGLLLVLLWALLRIGAMALLR